MSAPARPSDLDPAIAARLKRDAPACCRRGPAVRHRRGADGRLDGRRGAAPHAHHRPSHVLVPVAQEYWVKGRRRATSSGSDRSRLDCDGDTRLVRVDQVGAACHTGDRTCFDPGALPVATWTRSGRPSTMSGTIGPGPGELRPTGAGPTARAGHPHAVRRRARRRSASTASSPADRPGTFLLESAEPGRSWSRWSFVGVRRRPRCPSADGRATWTGPPPAGRADRGRPAGRAGAGPGGRCSGRGRRDLAELPPLTGGLVGYLGYDVVRRIERLPVVRDR